MGFYLSVGQRHLPISPWKNSGMMPQQDEPIQSVGKAHWLRALLTKPLILKC